MAGSSPQRSPRKCPLEVCGPGARGRLVLLQGGERRSQVLEGLGIRDDMVAPRLASLSVTRMLEMPAEPNEAASLETRIRTDSTNEGERIKRGGAKVN